MFKTYLPYIATESKQLKGIALAQPFMEDVKNLNCSWFYNWGVDIIASNYVPMSWDGTQVPSQETGYVLFLNEPENSSQANITPQIAVERLKILKAKRPNLKIIVGGCGLWGKSWMTLFKQINTVPISGYHIHGYLETNRTLQEVFDYWSYIKNNFPGEIWITEFSDVYGKQLPALLQEIEILKIDRYAYFTNRVKGTESNQAYPNNWPKPEKISLLTWDGQLTNNGEIYRGNIA